MTAKEIVLTRFQDAVAECQKTGEWTVWNIPVSMTRCPRWYGDDATTRRLFGLAVTEEGAWDDAARKIEKMEGRKLTANAELTGRVTGHE